MLPARTWCLLRLTKKGRVQKVPQLRPETPDEVRRLKMRCGVANIANGRACGAPLENWP